MLNLCNRGSQPTVIELVVKLVELADADADSSANPLKIDQWVWAFRVPLCSLLLSRHVKLCERLWFVSKYNI